MTAGVGKHLTQEGKTQTATWCLSLFSVHQVDSQLLTPLLVFVQYSIFNIQCSTSSDARETGTAVGRLRQDSDPQRSSTKSRFAGHTDETMSFLSNMFSCPSFYKLPAVPHGDPISGYDPRANLRRLHQLKRGVARRVISCFPPSWKRPNHTRCVGQRRAPQSSARLPRRFCSRWPPSHLLGSPLNAPQLTRRCLSMPRR